MTAGGPARLLEFYGMVDLTFRNMRIDCAHLIRSRSTMNPRIELFFGAFSWMFVIALIAGILSRIFG